MTTISRKWNRASILLGAILIISTSNAKAEDAVNTTEATAAISQQEKTQSQAMDQDYKLPPSYHGKYYPNDESAIGYHGTTKTTQNSQSEYDAGRNGSYYYYYY